MARRVPPTVMWSEAGGGSVRMIDQTRLPEELVMLDCREVECVAQAIERLSVRGAPAIGCAAALGMALAAYRSAATESDALRADLAGFTRSFDYRFAGEEFPERVKNAPANAAAYLSGGKK
mgnify:CR=1 FL=1